MDIAQWNLIQPNATISGLKRYDDEIYKQCSELGTVQRYGPAGNKYRTFLNYTESDVTHITTQQLAFLSVLKNVKRCVVTVHDIIQEHWYSRQRQIREYWFLNQLFLRNAGHFIADSHYTKMDLVDVFDIPEESIDVVYCGVDHKTFYPEDQGLVNCRELLGFDEDKTYVFAVSSGEPWKNTKLLKCLPFEVIDIGYGRGRFGYIDDSMLRAMYCACDVFLAPSKAEGFGLPILEAQACGCPVVASNCTSYPEVVGQGGQLVDPDAPEQWIEAVYKAAENRTKWGNRGIANARKFSWEHTGKWTWNVYKTLME